MPRAIDLIELRSLISEPTQDPYTDEVLALRIDEAPDLVKLARTIWREKAARYAGLVDVTEGSSSRKLSQLYKQALDMADAMSKLVNDAKAELPVVEAKRSARTRKIERQ